MTHTWSTVKTSMSLLLLEPYRGHYWLWLVVLQPSVSLKAYNPYCQSWLGRSVSDVSQKSMPASRASSCLASWTTDVPPVRRFHTCCAEFRRTLRTTNPSPDQATVSINLSTTNIHTCFPCLFAASTPKLCNLSRYDSGLHNKIHQNIFLPV